MNKNDYRPYLCKALTYYALGKQQQIIKENFCQADIAANNKQKLIISYYKEILGL